MKVLIIGRDAAGGNDIVVNDPKVSRTHCQLVKKDEGGCSIVDLGSSNGTFVNGQRIVGERLLYPHDTIRIGDTFLRWQEYLESPEKDEGGISPAPQSTDQRRGLEKKWVRGIAATILILLVGGGIGWHLSHKKASLGDPDLEFAELGETADDMIEIMALKAEADSLLVEALSAQTAEERKKYEIEAEEKQKLAAEKEKLLVQTTQLEKEKSDLANHNHELTNQRNKLSEEADRLTNEKNALEKKTSVLAADNKKLEENERLTSEFMKIWSSLENKNNIRRDVYIQYTSRVYSEIPGKDLVVEEFLGSDNDGKKKMLEIIRVTSEFYPEWDKLKESGANKVFERMGWTKQSNPKVQVKNRFNASDMEQKRLIVNTIKDVLSNNKDNAEGEKDATGIDSGMDEKTEMREGVAEITDEKPVETSGGNQ